MSPRFALLLVLAAACRSGDPAPADGCVADKDCKGERICVQKVCVDPTPAAPGAATAPSVTAPAAPSAAPATPSAAPAAPPVPDRQAVIASAPSLGAAAPGVLVIWFGDLECPHCARATPVVRKLIEKHGRPDGTVRVEYRHNPLDLHPGAHRLAVAAVAAHVQGRFWQLFDKVVEAGAGLTNDRLQGLADGVGIDAIAFHRDRTAPEVTARVASDRALALALGVKGTPAFFVNGRRLDGQVTFEALEALVNEELTAPVEGDRITTRTRANNAELAAVLFDGATPKPAPPPALPPPDATVWKVPVDADDASEGPADAAVTLVLFGDLECPFTARLSKTLESLREQRPTTRLVFKHQPLAVHPRAARAALYGAWAATHGRFWPFARHVLSGQPALADADLEAALRAAEAPVEGLEAAFAGPALRASIEADQALAARVDAIGTPNLYVNGRRLVGARTLEELTALVDEEAAKAEALATAGTPRAELYAAIIAKGQERQPLGGAAIDFELTGAPLGAADGPVTLVLFSDFQCPFSSRLVPILDRAIARFPGKLKLYFKHFPQDFHTEARAAAVEAICAAEQGKFWEVYRQFLDVEHQKDLSAKAREGLLKAAGVDVAAVGKCVNEKRADKVLGRDREEAERAEVKGTPTLFINGRRFTSPTGYNDRSLGRVLAQVTGQAPTPETPKPEIAPPAP